MLSPFENMIQTGSDLIVNAKLKAHYRNRNLMMLFTWSLWVAGWLITNWQLMVAGILALNLYAWGLMRYDKQASRKQKIRIPEKSLLLLSVLGGGLGIAIGMAGLRHKTKHISFQTIVPLSLIVYVVILATVVVDGK